MRGARRMMLGLVIAGVVGGAGTALASSALSGALAPSSTGLANAIAHVQANEASHPNGELANALSHLQANLAKHGGSH